MAYAISCLHLTPVHIETIQNMLTLKPEISYNKYSKEATPEPIIFYYIRDTMLYLPYLFASSLFQIIPNLNQPFLNTNLTFTGTLRPNQITVAVEAWNQLQKIGTTTLGLYPGFGKTILGAELASRAKLLTLVLVHREILTTQWKKTFEDVTNGKVWIVGEPRPPETCTVIICMDTRCELIPKEVQDQVGFLIIDEAHAFCTPNHVACLLTFQPKYIVVESATLERDDGMETMIYAICGTQGVFREFNTPFNVVKILTNTKPIRKLNRMKEIDYIALRSDTLFDPRRNQIILELTARNLNCKILILTALVDHAVYLHRALLQRGIKSDCLCGTKKGYEDATVLVGTISKIGTGFDQANFCPTYDGRPFDLLILVTSIRKTSALVQNVGRLFRSKTVPTLYHLVDNDDIFKNHWNRCRKWYLKHGGVITEYDIPNTDMPIQSTANVNQLQQQWIQQKLTQMKN
jgi:hypothetical protein